MQVKLRNNFFGPDNVYYKADDSPHTFDASWEDKLPVGAEVIGKGIVGSDDYKKSAKPAPDPKPEEAE